MEKVFDTWSSTYRCECPITKNVSLFSLIGQVNVFLEGPVREHVIKCFQTKDYLLMNVLALFQNDHVYDLRGSNRNVQVVQIVFPTIDSSDCFWIPFCSWKSDCELMRFFLDGEFARRIYQKVVAAFQNFATVQSKSFREKFLQDVQTIDPRMEIALKGLPQKATFVVLDCGESEIVLYLMWSGCKSVFIGHVSLYDCTPSNFKSKLGYFYFLKPKQIGKVSKKIVLAVQEGSLFSQYFVCGFGPLPEDKTNRVQILDLMPSNVKEMFCTVSKQLTSSIFPLWNVGQLSHQYMYLGARAGSRRVLMNYRQVSKEAESNGSLESFYGVNEYWRSHRRNSYRISDGKCSANVSFEVLTKKILLLNHVCVACSSCSYEIYRPPVCKMSSFHVCPSPQADPCFPRSPCREAESKKLKELTNRGGIPQFVDGVAFKVLIGFCAVLFVLVVGLVITCSVFSFRRVILLQRNEMVELYSKWNNEPENPDNYSDEGLIGEADGGAYAEPLVAFHDSDSSDDGGNLYEDADGIKRYPEQWRPVNKREHVCAKKT